MQSSFKSSRLILESLTLNDSEFIFRLVNTEGWINNIGNRNIYSVSDAENYIRKILNNPDVVYWVVKGIKNSLPIGIITFIKRDYLEYHDIGFAFLPEFQNQGFAYEASKIVLEKLISENDHKTILATTIPENENSIKLLKKLGFNFEKEIHAAAETLLVFSISNEISDTSKL